LTNEEGVKLVIKALLDVVESGNKNIELMVVTEKETRFLSEEELDKLIEAAKE
jgi:20S proteasome subunit alpha 4